MKKLRNLHFFYAIKIQLLFFSSVNCFAQSIPPQELHFIKDYHIRNFYNSQVILSKLDFSKKFLIIHCTNLITKHSPGVILGNRARHYSFLIMKNQSSKASLT